MEFKNGLAISYQFLGITHTSLGNLDQALTFFENYNSLEKELYAAYPQNVAFKNSLAIFLPNAPLGNLEGLEQLKDCKNSTPIRKMWTSKTDWPFLMKLGQPSLWIELVRDAPLHTQFEHYLELVRQDLEKLK